MRLLTYQLSDAMPCPGVLTEAGVINLSTRLEGAPRSLTQILEQFDERRSQIEALLGAQADHALADVKLLAPILRPGKILALGLNYRDHAVEANMALPEIQTWFAKMTTSTNGPFDPIHLPRVSRKLDYEAELGVVIGRRARHVSREQARDVIAGYVAANDVSVRDWQLRTSQFVVGKSFDTHCPFGPWITTTDEIPDPQALRIRCTVNGQTRQDSSTREMVFDVFQMIEHLSQAMTLEPGDLLITGTPAGVGAVSKPPRYLSAGDVVRVEIEKIGYIENRVVPEPA